MNNLVVEGNTIQLRADGHLNDVSDWTPEIAQQLASHDGLELTERHWNVINTMREYYQEYNTSPILKLLRKELSRKFGQELASVDTLSELFPNGVQYQGTRIAGIPVACLDAELDQNARVQSVKAEAAPVKHYVDQFECNGKTIKVYASGNLVNLEDWNEQVAQKLAEKEGIELTESHWVVLNFLRKFYFQYGVAPMVKILMKHMAEDLGAEAANKEHLYSMFPQGPAMQGSRIAGLPMPQGCIDG